MLKLCKSIRILIFLGMSFGAVSAQTSLVWNGSTSTDWATASNWTPNGVPGAGDTLLVPTAPTGSNGYPILSSVTPDLFTITLEEGSSLVIAASGELNMNGQDNGQLLMEGASVDNSGIIRMDSSDDGIDMVIGSGGTPSVFVNQAGASLLITNDDSDPVIMASGASTFDNFGIIDINSFDNDGLDNNSGTVFTNHASGSVTIRDAGDNYLEFDGTFVNNGTVTLVESTGFTGGGDGLCQRSGANFINTGTVNITGMKGGESVEVSGTLTNSGVFNINADADGFEAIVVESGATLTNEICGIINVISTDSIVLNSGSSTFDNQGLVATNFTGENTNLGSFINAGEIQEPNGNFTLAAGSNALTGGGAVVSGAAPASAPFSGCSSTAVPTLSQWGLIFFALILLCVAGVAITQRRSKLEAV